MTNTQPSAKIIKLPRSTPTPQRDSKRSTAYRFHSRHPMIDRVCFFMEESGETLTSIAKGSNVSLSTLINWKFGRTLSPQFTKLDNVLRYLGGEFAAYFPQEEKTIRVKVKKLSR